MLIGELVIKSGFSKDTIRFYEKIKLINLSKKLRRENNYKEYPDALLQKLLVIQKLKGFGFTLNEIQEIIVLYEEDLFTCSGSMPKVKKKLKLIDTKIKELKEIKMQLLNCIARCPEDCKVEGTLMELKK